MDSKKRMKLSAVLPACNEEQNIPRIKKELIDVLNGLNLDYEVLVIDDGSKDNTAAEVRKLHKRYGKVKLLSHPKNMGMGSAIRTGIKHATGDLLVTLDTDFTFHPRQIKGLLERLNKGDADCVIGSPTLKGYDKSIPLYRVFLSKGVNLIYNILLLKKITSVTPIFRLYKTKQLKELELSAKGFDINAEILVKLLLNKRRIVEIPALLTTRKYGVSKLNNIKEIKNHLILFSKIIAWRIRYLFSGAKR